MKLIERDNDWIKLIPENLGDLWFLYNEIYGKIVEQKSLRAKKIKRGNEIIKGKRTLRNIAIKVEKKSWESNRIKIIGRIVEGEDKNKHHSLYLEMDKLIKIKYLNGKLPEEEDYKIFVCLVSKEMAIFGLYRFGEIKKLREIQSKGRGEEFFKEVANNLKKVNEKILIAGHKNVKDRIINLTSKEMFEDSIYNVSERGFNELKKRDSLKKVIRTLREEKEKKMMEKFLKEINKNPNQVVYGKEIGKNVERIKEVLVLSEKIPEYEESLRDVEKTGGKVRIIDSNKDYVRDVKKFEIVGLLWW